MSLTMRAPLHPVSKLSPREAYALGRVRIVSTRFREGLLDDCREQWLDRQAGFDDRPR
jgi:hypothetical protein